MELGKINQISIIYEDSDLVIINKPSGLLTHPRNQNDTSESVVSWFIAKYPESANVIDDFIGEDDDIDYQNYAKLRPGIVHRLDKETSGVLVLAKNKPALQYLKLQFQNHSVQKTYIALSHGLSERKKGTINLPILSLGSKMTTKIEKDQEAQAKPAITDYRVLDRFQDDYTLFEVQPKTGRTHQIRLHLKAIGHPIVCDPLYSESRFKEPSDLNRLFLHASSITLSTPSGKGLYVEAELPQELTDFIAKSTPIARS